MSLKDETCAMLKIPSLFNGFQTHTGHIVLSLRSLHVQAHDHLTVFTVRVIECTNRNLRRLEGQTIQI